MRSSIFIFIIILLIATIALPGAAVQANQPGVPGFAEITDPAPGQFVDGLITVQGTAFHPDFKSYELFFSYDPNPTDTWFPLTDQIDTPVQEDGLALWDTSTITPGTYQLRLRVYSNQDQTIEAIVGGIRLGGERAAAEIGPAESEPPDQTTEGQDPAAPPEAQPEAEQLEQIQPITPEQTLTRLLLTGAAAAALLLIGFGGYTLLRPRFRAYMGLMRMRRMHREQRRQERDRTESR